MDSSCFFFKKKKVMIGSDLVPPRASQYLGLEDTHGYLEALQAHVHILQLVLAYIRKVVEEARRARNKMIQKRQGALVLQRLDLHDKEGQTKYRVGDEVRPNTADLGVVDAGA
jgi:hypothetical protein